MTRDKSTECTLFYVGENRHECVTCASNWCTECNRIIVLCPFCRSGKKSRPIGGEGVVVMGVRVKECFFNNVDFQIHFWCPSLEYVAVIL